MTICFVYLTYFYRVLKKTILSVDEWQREGANNFSNFRVNEPLTLKKNKYDSYEL